MSLLKPLNWTVKYAVRKFSPLFTGGSVNVHALRSGQTLGLSLKAVGGRAGQGAHTLTALTSICHPCKTGKENNTTEHFKFKKCFDLRIYLIDSETGVILWARL